MTLLHVGGASLYKGNEQTMLTEREQNMKKLFELEGRTLKAQNLFDEALSIIEKLREENEQQKMSCQKCGKCTVFL